MKSQNEMENDPTKSILGMESQTEMEDEPVKITLGMESQTEMENGSTKSTLGMESQTEMEDEPVKITLGMESQAEMEDDPAKSTLVTQCNVRVIKPWTKKVPSLKKPIKSSDTIPRDLYDCAYLADGHLVVTARRKKRLLLFDGSAIFQNQYLLKCGPRGVCVRADDSHIYVVHVDGTVVTYMLQGELKEVSHVNVQKDTTGVGVSGETIITGHKDNITLYNMEGEKLSSISKEGINTYICVSQNGSRFYHRDGDHIVCRSVSDLSEVFRYSHPELHDPRGIACDRHGNILVAGWGSGNIIMMDKDGKHVASHELCGIKAPSGVCCNPQRDEFVVLGWRSKMNVNVMEVYKMK